MKHPWSINLPFAPTFGLEDLGGKIKIAGPYEIVSATPKKVIIKITPEIAGKAITLTEAITPDENDRRAHANWRAAVTQLRHWRRLLRSLNRD